MEGTPKAEGKSDAAAGVLGSICKPTLMALVYRGRKPWKGGVPNEPGPPPDSRNSIVRTDYD